MMISEPRTDSVGNVVGVRLELVHVFQHNLRYGSIEFLFMPGAECAISGPEAWRSWMSLCGVGDRLGDAVRIFGADIVSGDQLGEDAQAQELVPTTSSAIE